jgi:hypothetical protein
MSLSYPIFNDDPIFGNKLIKTSCPAKSDICGNLSGTSVLDTFVIPKCNDLNFKFSLDPDQSPNGCCVVDTSNDTCETYITDSPKFSGDDYDIGIQFLDANNLNGFAMSLPLPFADLKLNSGITIEEILETPDHNVDREDDFVDEGYIVEIDLRSLRKFMIKSKSSHHVLKMYVQS